VVTVKQPDEVFIRAIRALNSYEKMSPEDMEKGAEFWSTALGSEFSWASTGDLRRLTSCKHVDFHKPQIFVGHLARKNHVDCVTCGLRRVARSAKDNPDRCDECGARGVESFYAFIAQSGMFLILGEICPDCKENHKESINELFESFKESEDEGDKDVQDS